MLPDAALLTEAATRALRYLSQIDDRDVAPSAQALVQLAEFDEPLPDGPTDPTEVLRLLDDIGSPATVVNAGRRYFGFVNGGALPVTLAANWLAGAWDQNAASRVMSPTASVLEDVAKGWLLDLLGFSSSSEVGFVSGATMANLSGLAAGRRHVLQQVGWDVEAEGLFGAPPITVIVGEEVHVSALKALGLLGLGRERVVRVPTDGQGRMRAAALPQIDGPALVCLQAGNVNTGAFDPFADIIPQAQASGAWVHVDGAFGLWAAASPSTAPLLAGVTDADSCGLDAHKWLNVPYDSGLVLCRHPEVLHRTMAISASYLTFSQQREPYAATPEMSRRARGVEVWAALRALGRSGVAELVDRCCRHAHRFAEGLRASGYAVLNDVNLNQVLVAFGDAETTERVIAALQAEGTCWCGGTVWQGYTAMRISVSSWATTEADVDRCLKVIRTVAEA